MKVKETVYGEPTKYILATPDHYVNIARRLEKNSNLAVDEDGKKIVKAGTIYPANNATAEGVVFNDYDVTDSEVNAAILIHGFIQTSKLPVEPTEEAKQALKQITFLKANII